MEEQIILSDYLLMMKYFTFLKFNIIFQWMIIFSPFFEKVNPKNGLPTQTGSETVKIRNLTQTTH